MPPIDSSRSAADVHELTLSDERYPDRLRNLSDPPPLLYVRGDVELLARERLVAVIGTREPTVFGISAAQELTGVLADGGWGIVSGLARGIDTIAHRTALEHGTPTIAVMGGGLDRIGAGRCTPCASRPRRDVQCSVRFRIERTARARDCE